MAKPVRLRELAASDLEDVSDHYRSEAGEQVALEFIDAAARGMQRIGRSPHVGSLRFSFELAIPNLRAWALQRFPYVVFYVVTDHEVDVWRIFHARRDLPAIIEPPTS